MAFGLVSQVAKRFRFVIKTTTEEHARRTRKNTSDGYRDIHSHEEGTKLSEAKELVFWANFEAPASTTITG